MPGTLCEELAGEGPALPCQGVVPRFLLWSPVCSSSSSRAWGARPGNVCVLPSWVALRVALTQQVGLQDGGQGRNAGLDVSAADPARGARERCGPSATQREPCAPRRGPGGGQEQSPPVQVYLVSRAAADRRLGPADTWGTHAAKQGSRTCLRRDQHIRTVTAATVTAAQTPIQKTGLPVTAGGDVGALRTPRVETRKGILEGRGLRAADAKPKAGTSVCGVRRSGLRGPSRAWHPRHRRKARVSTGLTARCMDHPRPGGRARVWPQLCRVRPVSWQFCAGSQQLHRGLSWPALPT